jgi:3-phosphoshikimate 1-carboxyvinyltransferase
LQAVKIEPSNLNGKIKIPPSKSLCHRAIIAAGLSGGRSEIYNVIYSEDIRATCSGMRSLGVEILEGENSLTVDGSSFGTLTSKTIDCNESGSTLRFLIPLALLAGEEVTFTGRGRLASRPLNPYYKIFDSQNIKYSSREGLPLTLQGVLVPGDYEVEGNISSQFITGLMFALPLLDGDSRIVITKELESKGYVDLTLDMLKRFSVEIENRGYREFYIKGNQKYNSMNYRVEGDFSQAAFWLTAGILGGEIECSDISQDSLQGDKAILDIIRAMGGDITVNGDGILARPSKTRGITIDASECPDLVPILSVLASVSEGTTRIVRAERLRIKESDRLKSMATELKKLGADVTETADGLIINGVDRLGGGTLDSWNDHRIAMALAVASIKCTEPVIIINSDTVKKSYPDFFKDFSMLGGNVSEWSMGT